ncbi:MAG: adenosylmethionine decarboxylase [Labedaea sp.]
MPTRITGAPAGSAFAGRHVLAELHGVDAAVLNDVDLLCTNLERALKEAGATVCEIVSKRFEPQGATVVALLAESHASVHTYPERGSVFVDVFTCGRRADPNEAVRLLGESLGAASIQLQMVHRGQW